MTRTLCAALALLAVMFTGTASAATAVVGVEGGADEVRGLQLLTLQALQDAGLGTADPQSLRGPLDRSTLVERAGTAGGERVFLLHAVPLQTSRILVLEELGPAQGETLHRASLVLDDPSDADRVMRRLVDAVLARTAPDEASIDTVTAHEGRAFSKRPGEFLWGFGVLAGLAVDADGDAAAIYGMDLLFLYEIEHANFGVTLRSGGSGDLKFMDGSVRVNYLFLDGDFSPYVGGAFGISAVTFDDADGDADAGAHFTVGAGMELFRLRAARMLVGIDVMLPLYELEQGDGNGGARSSYSPIPLFEVSILF